MLVSKLPFFLSFFLLLFSDGTQSMLQFALLHAQRISRAQKKNTYNYLQANSIFGLLPLIKSVRTLLESSMHSSKIQSAEVYSVTGKRDHAAATSTVCQYLIKNIGGIQDRHERNGLIDLIGGEYDTMPCDELYFLLSTPLSN